MKIKRYIVWAGREPGIYQDWPSAEKQVKGFPGCKYKKVEVSSEDEAQAIFRTGLDNSSSKMPTSPKQKRPSGHFLTVDAASSAQSNCQWRGVWLDTDEQQFKSKLFNAGTNNIGEFLALVHGIKVLRDLGEPVIIYSDSETAICWVKNGICNTTARENGRMSDELESIIARAEGYLCKAGLAGVEIRKWNTKAWGEIPADFGNK